MIEYVKDYASDEVPILKVPLYSGDIELEQPVRGPMMPPQPEIPAPPLTQEESELLDARAFGHRATGKTYRQIARKLNIPSSSAYKRVQREMGRRREEFAEDEADSRELIVALLDGALEAIAAQAYEGDQKAFHLLLQHANTRVRLAKIENPASLDKMIRKINAAAAVAQETAAQEAKASQPAVAKSAQEVEEREEAKELSLPECESGPGNTDERCERLKGAKSRKGEERCEGPQSAKGENGCGQDRGQKCGQESQPLAEEHIAVDEKICAEHVDALDENVNGCEPISREATRIESANLRVTPTRANWGTLSCGLIEG